MTSRLLALIALLLLLPATLAAADDGSEVEEQPRVVVAVVDEPVNPYHQWFHQGGEVYGDTAPSSVTPALLDELGIDEDHIIRLTRTGDWQADYDADRAQFDAARDGELYWYEGTNLIVASFDTDDAIQLLPDSNGESHGTGTAGAVIQANPEAVVIHVDTFTSTDGEAFVHSLPQVDITSHSYGWVGGAPVPFHLDASYEGVVVNGKLTFGAAGNQPTPDLQSQAGGAWWQVGVGGYHEGDDEGQEPLSAVLPDVVGDFTIDLPRCGQCEIPTGDYSGTSFSTPRAAGTASKVLLEARRAAGHLGGIVTEAPDGTALERPAMIATDGVTLTNWDLRRALEEAAWVPATGDWRPSATYPINDAFPWPQVGWGLLTPDPERGVVDQAVAHLGLSGEAPTRVKPTDACAFMTANQESRRAYWTALPTSDDFVGTDYPYEGCGL